jgi:transposase-like protein
MASKKTYTREFREEAVRLAQQNGNTSETARNLGLQLSVLRRRKKEPENHGEKPFRARDTLMTKNYASYRGESAVKGNG